MWPLKAVSPQRAPPRVRALFADLRSSDKHLVVSPGTHTEVPRSAVDAMVEWIASRLEARPGA